MITCTLGEKKYTVDYITGRALREMEPAAKMYAKIVAVANAAAKGETVPEEQQFTIPEAMDAMIRWFCLLFCDQFTVDDVLDHYPSTGSCTTWRWRFWPCRRRPPASSTIFLRPRQRRRRRRARPDAAGIHLFHLQLAARERLAHGRDRPHGHARLLPHPCMEGQPRKEAHSAPAPLHRRGLAQYETLIPTHQGR